MPDSDPSPTEHPPDHQDDQQSLRGWLLEDVGRAVDWAFALGALALYVVLCTSPGLSPSQKRRSLILATAGIVLLGLCMGELKKVAAGLAAQIRIMRRNTGK